MKDLFVPYSIAVKLKEKGFNEPCLAAYYERATIEFAYSPYLDCDNKEYLTNDYKGSVSAPLWQQVVDWLREEKGVKVVVKHQDSTGGNNYEIWKWNFDNNIGKWERSGNIQSYESYYSALQSGIEKALELI